MTLDDGTIQICNLINSSDAGSMPDQKLSPVITQYYGEKDIGITRQYLAKGADEQVDMVVRIWNEGTRPQIAQYAVIVETEDQYRIDNVQPTHDDDGLKVFDLTLRRLETYYDIQR
jgi:hypothetical protein